MIICRLSGGLGNQMFQYAAARALSLRRKTSLAVDISAFDSPDKYGVSRRYVLDNFNIHSTIATDEDYESMGISPISGTDIVSKTQRAVQRIWQARLPYSKKKVIVEPRFTFVAEILEAPSDCLLIGVWQSESYFADCKDVVRQELRLKTPLSPEAQEIAQKIHGSRSISIHVRRGDYVENASTNQKHGTSSPEYYAAAISYMTERFSNLSFFVFSDDIEWVKANLRIPNNPLFVSSRGLEDFEEMSLMSLCDHHIIANSSFSWWGAWLGKNPDKTVIAPKQWFSAESENDTDIVPSEWQRL